VRLLLPHRLQLRRTHSHSAPEEECAKRAAGVEAGIARAVRRPASPFRGGLALPGNARKALAEIQRGLIKPTARGLSEDEVLFLELR